MHKAKKRTDSARKLKATFRELFCYLDTSEILANLRDYRGWNSKTVGEKMSAIGRTELPMEFF